MRFSKPALLVYTFARREPLSPEAREYLATLWDACGQLGMGEPVNEVHPSCDFPADVGVPKPEFEPLASRIDASRYLQGTAYYQAFLFGYYDVVGMVACLSPLTSENALAHWRTLYQRWLRSVEQVLLPEGVLQEVYLFHALVEEHTEDFTDWAAKVLTALPIGMSSETPTLCAAPEGFVWWEGVPCEGRRVFAMLAPESREAEATACLLWGGKRQPAPFVRCLLHAAKMQHEWHVYHRDMPALHRQREAIDCAITEVLGHNEQMAPCAYTPVDNLVCAQVQLSEAQAATTGLLMSLSRLKELRTTVHIAARNLRAAAQAVAGGSCLFGKDLEQARWLEQQIACDVDYLQAVRERAQEAYQLTQLQLEQAKEHTARRQSQLDLLQTSLLGALLTTLAAIEALQVRLPLPESLHLPLVAFVTTLALALPPLFIRWHEPYQRSDYLFGALLGASTGWLGLAALFHAWNRTPPPLLAISVAALSALLFALLLYGLDKRQRRQSEPSERRLEPSKSDSGASKSHLGQE